MEKSHICVTSETRLLTMTHTSAGSASIGEVDFHNVECVDAGSPKSEKLSSTLMDDYRTYALTLCYSRESLLPDSPGSSSALLQPPILERGTCSAYACLTSPFLAMKMVDWLFCVYRALLSFYFKIL